MFKNLRAVETKTLNHSGRSYVGETLQLEGDLRTSGNLDIAGLINGNVYVSDATLTQTGSIRGIVQFSCKPVIYVYSNPGEKEDKQTTVITLE